MNIDALRPTSAGRPRVLAVLGGLWPGHEANGPSQSIVGICSRLSGEFDFAVIARDRPFGGKLPLIESDRWFDRGYAHFRYLPARERRVADLRATIAKTPHDIILLNSFFDPEFTIPILMMRRLGLLPNRPLILAPRGEFSAGALSIKPLRKRAYLSLARRLGLLANITFHATSDRERGEIIAALPDLKNIAVASNVRPPLPPPAGHNSSADGVLKLVYLSRIDRKKNLRMALELLGRVETRVRYDIYGPVSDESYWFECQALSSTLPANVEIRYLGLASHEMVHELFGSYDAMFLPTAGENYGHAIVDAFSSGCPVITSDQTPWIDLEAQCAGWSLPLNEPHRFIEAIHKLSEMSQGEKSALRAGARRFAEKLVNEGDAVEATRTMFLAALERSCPTEGGDTQEDVEFAL